MTSPYRRMHGRMPCFLRAMQCPPAAVANICGSPKYAAITGKVRFYQLPLGVLVAAEVFHLPAGDTCHPVFAFHIHSGSACTGSETDAFADAKAHYDPEGNPHPAHAGDLLPLMGNNGYAFEVFLTDRFSVRDIIGKTAIIHLQPDDFTSQPAGNAGEKIACGQIAKYR